MSKGKYVVLEHLCLPNRGFRFWTTVSEDNTHSYKGDLWYKEILFTDDTQEAIEASRITNREAIPTFQEMLDYHRQEIDARNEKSKKNTPSQF